MINVNFTMPFTYLYVWPVHVTDLESLQGVVLRVVPWASASHGAMLFILLFLTQF